MNNNIILDDGVANEMLLVYSYPNPSNSAEHDEVTQNVLEEIRFC